MFCGLRIVLTGLPGVLPPFGGKAGTKGDRAGKTAEKKEGTFMNLNYKFLALTAALAAGIALTACGSGPVLGSTSASSVVPASSHVAEEGVTEPINMLTWTLDDLDREDTVTFVSASILSGVKDGSLTADVFSYDLYKKEDIENLAAGDQITFHEEGAAWNQYVTVAVDSIEKNAEYQIVSINGGMEEKYGLDLLLDGDTYRTMTFDDYPVYYEMGEKAMPLAQDAVLKDSSADPQAEAVETRGADAVAAAINADPDNWTVYNTTLVVQGGKVQEVRRIWVP